MAGGMTMLEDLGANFAPLRLHHVMDFLSQDWSPLPLGTFCRCRPHAECTFTGTLMNAGDIRRNSGECQGSSREYGAVLRESGPRSSR